MAKSKRTKRSPSRVKVHHDLRPFSRDLLVAYIGTRISEGALPVHIRHEIHEVYEGWLSVHDFHRLLKEAHALIANSCKVSEAEVFARAYMFLRSVVANRSNKTMDRVRAQVEINRMFGIGTQGQTGHLTDTQVGVMFDDVIGLIEMSTGGAEVVADVTAEVDTPTESG